MRSETILDAAVEAIVRRAQEGDREAFAELIRRHERIALSLAYAVLADGDAAGDVSQDAFLRAWQRLAELRQPERFAPWLCGIVRNMARDALRRGRREQIAQSRAAQSHAGQSHAGQDRAGQTGRRRPPADPALELERQETSDQIAAALHELDEETRMAVILRYYDGLGSKQIGEVLELSAAAVDMRLMRARQFLRVRLDDGTTSNQPGKPTTNPEVDR